MCSSHLKETKQALIFRVSFSVLIAQIQQPVGVAASINGKDYYLFTGEYGKKASQKNIESQVIKKGPNGPSSIFRQLLARNRIQRS